MSHSRKPEPERPNPRADDLPAGRAEGKSRRAFLRSGAGLAAGGAAAQVLPEPALAQPAGTAERNPDVRRGLRQSAAPRREVRTLLIGYMPQWPGRALPADIGRL
jgi:hypothetical protein